MRPGANPLCKQRPLLGEVSPKETLIWPRMPESSSAKGVTGWSYPARTCLTLALCERGLEANPRLQTPRQEHILIRANIRRNGLEASCMAEFSVSFDDPDTAVLAPERGNHTGPLSVVIPGCCELPWSVLASNSNPAASFRIHHAVIFQHVEVEPAQASLRRSQAPCHGVLADAPRGQRLEGPCQIWRRLGHGGL